MNDYKKGFRDSFKSGEEIDKELQRLIRQFAEDENKKIKRGLAL